MLNYLQLLYNILRVTLALNFILSIVVISSLHQLILKKTYLISQQHLLLGLIVLNIYTKHNHHSKPRRKFNAFTNLLHYNTTKTSSYKSRVYCRIKQRETCLLSCCCPAVDCFTSVAKLLQ